MYELFSIDRVYEEAANLISSDPNPEKNNSNKLDNITLSNETILDGAFFESNRPHLPTVFILLCKMVNSSCT